MPIPTPEEMAVADEAIHAANTIGMEDEEAKALKDEKAQVANWLGRIKDARAFDKDVWKQMSMDRAYAAGFSTGNPSVNLIGSAIDVMKSFLYAKDPDISVVPAATTTLPRLERPVAPVDPMAQMMQSPQAQQLSQDAGAMTAVMQDPAVMAEAQPLLQQYEMEKQQYQMAQQAYMAEMKQRRDVRERRKRLCETMEILCSKSWKMARMKTHAKSSVAANLTTGLGWLKVAWHEDAGLDPETVQRKNSIQDNIRSIDALRSQVEEGTTGNLDALRQQLVEAQAGLDSKSEVVVSRGLTIDAIPGEDMTTPIGVTKVTAVEDAPWLAHRVFFPISEGATRFPDLTPEELRKASTFTQSKPRVATNEKTPVWESVSDNPGQFTTAGDGKAVEMTDAAEGAGQFGCAHEIWDRVDNMIRTVIEGVAVYAKPPHAPEIATTRFYPFFNMAFIEADGQRYPQSLTWRSHQIQDDFNARLQALKKQRISAKQGILGNATMLEKDQAQKIKQSVEGETTYVHTVGEANLQNVFMAKPTVQLDPALYETESTRNNFEEIWGVRQALQSGDTQKTATQADIENQGFTTRTGYMRDALEIMLQEVAITTGEILLQRLTLEDAKAFAGEGAEWPESVTAEDLADLVSITIRAGSTGKPNTASERQAWAQTFPVLKEAVQVIGQLRGSDPHEVADKIEQLAEITIEMAGLSIDVESIMPQEGSTPEQSQADPMMGGGGAPGIGELPPDPTEVPQQIVSPNF